MLEPIQYGKSKVYIKKEMDAKADTFGGFGVHVL